MGHSPEATSTGTQFASSSASSGSSKATSEPLERLISSGIQWPQCHNGHIDHYNIRYIYSDCSGLVSIIAVYIMQRPVKSYSRAATFLAKWAKQICRAFGSCHGPIGRPALAVSPATVKGLAEGSRKDCRASLAQNLFEKQLESTLGPTRH